MRPREDNVDKEDRQGRYDRRRGYDHNNQDFTPPPKKRQEPYKRERLTYDDWDEEDDWFDDNN